MRHLNHDQPEPGNNRLPALPNSYFVQPGELTIEPASSSPGIDYWHLLRKYLILLSLFAVAGAAAGFFSVAFLNPVYQSRALLEVQAPTVTLFKNSGVSGNDEVSQVNIQTQIQLLRSSSFLRRVMERLQLETVPPPPVQNDIFSRLRRRLTTNTQDPMALMTSGLNVALATFDARPINGTRIIEITCDSTSPDIAANFVNTLANEYIEQNSQGRAQNLQQTSQWLSGQLEETRNKLQEAQQHLQEFVQSSGNLFVLQDNTLDNSKLRQLQGELSAIQADRIAKQAKYELVAKTSPEALPGVLEDINVRGYQTRIADLRREAAVLKTTLTPDNPKVKKIEVQINELQITLNKEVTAEIQRIKNDYDVALRREKLLSADYTKQASQVSAEATKASQYSGLKREVETLQQTYSAMLLQANESNINSSVPLGMGTIRLVDPSTPPAKPYKPRPALNIAFGTMAGLFLSVGIAFLWERMDKSVRTPGHSRTLLNVPELGVIPSIEPRGSRPAWRLLLGRESRNAGEMVGSEVSLDTRVGFWDSAPASQLLADSFRVTLASLMLGNGTRRPPRVILVTSPGAGEGKTTIVSNLGTALAETGRSVLILDGDFRRPRLHKVFDLADTWGLTNILEEGSAAPERFGLLTTVPGLFVMPNGPKSGSISKMLYGSEIRRFFQMVREKYDIVLIDAPPILEVADGRLLAEFADGVLLVLRSGVTDRVAALQAYQQLSEDQTPLLGTVLNDFKATRRSRQGYYNYAGR
ncbi:MAG: hypothetical protein C5B51_16590 [Terriglobia bacterium]|nr:MAG: hypothetical protein C5B51_16590 [Terriglobia bacterium]